MPVEFKLPELGENVEKGDVVRVLVAPGDMVKLDQAVLELETDKATIEVPSTVAGRVADVRVKAGDKVKVGQVVFRVEPAEAVGSVSQSAAKADAAAPLAAAPAPAAKPTATPEPKSGPAPSRVDGVPPSRAEGKTAEVVDISAARVASTAAPARPDAAPAGAPLELAAPVPAAPSVRRLAREIGVDIGEVAGSGPGGRIDENDVKQHVKTVLAGSAGLAGGGRAAPLPDFTKWGDIEIRPMTNIRRKTAEHLSIAWRAPHVTQHDRADVTMLEAFRTAYGPRVEKAGGKLTVTAIVIKVVASALARFPQFASSVDMAKESIVYKKYCHVGVAVDTPNGLLVPVIRQADRKTITEIAVELTTLSQKARDRKLSLEEMAGSVFSVTNLGGIGGTAFTPIINQPEVAILGVSRGAIEPVWRDGQFVPRELLPLSLSYDHRVIDGADAARFLRFVAEALEQPLTMAL
jgi:pyruvate dehydrogenase E2 component (dihydrolipoamide acetyltransferase)